MCVLVECIQNEFTSEEKLKSERDARKLVRDVFNKTREHFTDEESYQEYIDRVEELSLYPVLTVPLAEAHNSLCSYLCSCSSCLGG